MTEPPAAERAPALADGTPPTTALAASPEFDARPKVRWRDRPPRWYVQVSLVVIYYWLYAEARDWHGSIADDPDSFLTARDDGLAVLDIERWLHIDVELGWQHALLQVHWLVKGLDAFYGSAHFLVTALVLAYLLLRGKPAVYRYWRNVLALATGVALACFALFPTLPPRLLPSPYGYVDTLHVVGGLWSYNSGVLEHISDPYAALPSLHIVWAGWCALVLWRLLRGHWTRWLAVGYPFLTAFAVIVTGNHWILDLVAGASVLLGSWALTAALHRRTDPLSAPAAGAAPWTPSH
ncbi:MAG: phosphatase PAP2 family protein [Candidatus Dormibacteraeota bacterium]|uniref:phosphatase PAP2 family protein n=1 Tax=Candidatus Dormibacter sp. TaxID=2973982 RepID=UPI0026BC48B2|nr:phosphatase PAP2 family protein [Candidatus Dormibacteraeota bacterium]